MPAGLPRLLLYVAALAPLGSAIAQPVAVHQPTQKTAPEAARTQRQARFLAGRQRSGERAAALLERARRQHAAMLLHPESSILSAAWTPLGPNQVNTAKFGNVNGRVTAIALDPADSTGNTVYVGTTGGGVWKSTNAAGPAAAVLFLPLTDTLPVFNGGGISGGSATVPSLSIGSLAISNGVVLAGTGDPNDATDSYYGAGILRSADGGASWTVAQGSLDGVAGNHSFFGLSVAGLALSTANPSLAVAAISHAAEGDAVNAPDATYSRAGLYYSTDAGVTWHMATIEDGSFVVQGPGLSAGTNDNPATAVVWNAARGQFLAAVRSHGYYSSFDGATWTRLLAQPGAGLSAAACPPFTSAGCPIFRGALAVQAATGDTFALTVDAGNHDGGLYQDACAPRGSACGNGSISFAIRLNSLALETAGGTAIQQADYNLALAATPLGSDTALFVGTLDLYRCTLAAGCTLRNTTNAANGCTNPARVAPGQHALAALPPGGASLLYLGNDGGLWRSSDGVAEGATPCSLDDATHFQNLNAGFGSLAEVVSFAQDPKAAGTLLAGLGALGTAGTGTVTNSWPQLATGEGGAVAIDPSNPTLWYVSDGAGVMVARCDKGASCSAADFAATAIGPAQIAADASAVHAPWLLDPDLPSNLIVGTCRAWRGPATGGALWSTANALSRPFAAPAASACGPTFAPVRSLAAGGTPVTSSNAQNAGSPVIYAGLAGGGTGVSGHLFVTSAAVLAGNSTVWSDAALAPVSNDLAAGGIFNPGQFDVSSIAADPHDSTGATVYATVMGFAANGIDAPHLYRSVDAGAHWTNISSNLPNAPANSVVVDPNDANTLYVALDTGVYVTTQVTNCAVGNCWSVFGLSLPNAPVVELQAGAAVPTEDGRTGLLRAATYGRGIWQIPLLTATYPAAPSILLSPAAVAYPDQQVGTSSASVTITVTNTGSTSLTVSRVSTSGDFVETDTCVGGVVAPNARCTVQVQFAPSVAGARSGVLTVYGNVSGGQSTALLSGVGTPGAAVVLTPTALLFPSISVGATSAAQAITISNTGGSAALLQTPAVSGDFHLAGNTCGPSLAPNTGCTVSIVFAPVAAGPRAGTLSIVDSAGTEVASLSGSGTNPATDALAPLSLSFAPQPLNLGSNAQQVTLTNNGDVALTLIAAQVLSGDFLVVNGCGNSLNAHAVCSMAVTFLPKSLGAQAGVLEISDQFRTQSVALSGFGLAPPGVSLSPLGGLSFAALGVGLSSPVQTVTLTNNGGVPLLISKVATNGDFALVAGTNTCGSSLAPAAVCTAGVVFLPSTVGPRTGLITFFDNAASATQSVSLSGTGVDFLLNSNGPSSLTVKSGGTATYVLLLSSASTVPGMAASTCSGVPAHTLCTVNPANPALGGNSVVTVTVATGLASVELQPPAMPWSGPLVWLAMLLPLALLRRRTHTSRVVCALAVLLSAAGCAKSRTLPADSSPGTPVSVVTPPGTYTLVVAASSAGLVRTTNLTLVVQ